MKNSLEVGKADCDVFKKTFVPFDFVLRLIISFNKSFTSSVAR